MSGFSQWFAMVVLMIVGAAVFLVSVGWIIRGGKNPQIIPTTGLAKIAGALTGGFVFLIGLVGFVALIADLIGIIGDDEEKKAVVTSTSTTVAPEMESTSTSTTTTTLAPTTSTTMPATSTTIGATSTTGAVGVPEPTSTSTTTTTLAATASTATGHGEVADVRVVSADGQPGLGRSAVAHGQTISSPPSGKSHWLVIKPGDDDHIHPVDRLPNSGAWDRDITLGTKGEVTGGFDIWVVCADAEADADFDHYLKVAAARDYKGMRTVDGETEQIFETVVHRTR